MTSSVVVGGGPAGLTIALGLASHGHHVTLLDEWHELGGSLAWEESASERDRLASLRNAVLADPKLSVRQRTVVWAAFPHVAGYEVMLSSGDEASSLIATNLILATGTTDIAGAWPGSTLSGVMTERAFRILVSKHGILPGNAIALVGGATSGRLAAEVTRWKLGSRVTNVSAKMLVSINGSEQVESLSLSNGTNVAADTVVLSLGEAPDLQLAGMLDVRTEYDPVRHAWFARDTNPRPGLYLAGGALLGQVDSETVVRSAHSTIQTITSNGASE